MIKNIFFDLGNVLIDIDINKTFNCLKINTIDDYIRGNETPTDHFLEIDHKYERGEISTQDFKNAVCKLFNLNMTDKEFADCWNALVLSIPPQRQTFLHNLAQKYNLFILSNINELHYQKVISADYWNPKLFQKCYFSHLAGMRKPEDRFFKYVLADSGVNPQETVFFDDNKHNVQAALRYGINAFVVRQPIEIIFDNAIKKIT